ncbi:ABC transporter ATP-binding protein [Paenibacillus donghaensis]|uniref:ABC transporter ATP-binding protein n=1 Tax=Paenibacillus donghaensis TaxID=414771 RepID=UPI0012FAFA10|nr:ABC transporter ATP-binding protein [Paenibacillus donghaensis]
MSIELAQLQHAYPQCPPVLQDFNLTLSGGELIGVTGASGSGKSTLLNIAGGILKPDAGRVTLNGIDIFGMKERPFEKFKLANIGYIFQRFNLIPFLNVLDNIMLPVTLLKADRRQYKQEALRLLESLNMEHKAKSPVAELSGGEQQRVAIARAFIMSPGVLLADEPTGSLDYDNTIQFMELLLALVKQKKVSCILVTHDREVANYCDRVIHLGKDERRSPA